LFKSTNSVFVFEILNLKTNYFFITFYKEEFCFQLNPLFVWLNIDDF